MEYFHQRKLKKLSQNAHINSLTAIGGHGRQLFDKLLW
jgi:hypothetical protein